MMLSVVNVVGWLGTRFRDEYISAWVFEQHQVSTY